MSKIKMRCIACGKWFQSANAKEVTCPDCMQKARKEKLASKNAPPMNKPAGLGGQTTYNPTRPVAPPPKQKPTQSGTKHWFDEVDDVKIGQPEQPPARPKLPPSPAPRDQRSRPTGPGGYRPPTPGNYRDDRGPGSYREGGYRDGGYREGGSRGPGAYREQEYRGPGSYRIGGPQPEAPGYRPRQPMEPGRGFRPDRPVRPPMGRENAPGGYKPRQPAGKAVGPAKVKTPKPPAPPKPKREKTPPPEPFTPTAEQIQQVEERYLELSTPSEFDGIRTQISKELGVPKKAVKKIIKDLRSRQNIPSWWELQTYKGSREELDKIRAAYEPLLPIPPIGVHKQIAEQLSLKPGVVYQAIKSIRQEMNLPQYNDPDLHGEDLTSQKKSGHQKQVDQDLVSPEEAQSNEGTPSAVSATAAVENRGNITE